MVAADSPARTSNIRPRYGTGHAAAATILVMLMAEARRLGLSGVALKADPALPANVVV
jgi:ethanolamine ammonia-lyase small subunit